MIVRYEISEGKSYKPIEKEVCFQESNTIVCGKLIFYDHDKIEKELTVEPFYGDCDLFGF